jgi:hypothetical protein
MNIDWRTLEDHLFSLAMADIRRFADAHRDEQFYGFAFDCNSDYGQILLCLNTQESLRETALQYATNPPNKEVWDRINKALGFPSDEQRETPAEYEQELCWSLGDWKYQGFNTKAFDSGWASFGTDVLNACMDEEEDKETFLKPTQDRFLRAVCRVLLRLEIEGGFQRLNRTDDFGTFVTDHDEPDEVAWHRLETVRNETRRR